MNGASHLLLRSGTYYFQRRVPEHIKDALQYIPQERISGLSPDC